MEIVRGHILLANGQLEEAEQTFRHALQYTKDAPRTMLRIIVSLYDNRYIRSSYILLKNFFRHVDEDWKEGYAYMAVCCLDMNKQDEFLHYLKMAVERNPKEARTVLSGYFPEGMAPEEYYEYMVNKISNQ
jgi:tetratricopeptide (TPR) repeat protein